MKVHPLAVGAGAPQLISKASFKVLDNDVKTAWINPRLISKVGLQNVTGSMLNLRRRVAPLSPLNRDETPQQVPLPPIIYGSVN